MKAAVAAVAGAGAALVASRKPDPSLRGKARTWAARRGVDPLLLDTIISVESNWDPDATNLKGGDLARGGAWGLTQLTYRTALDVEANMTAAGARSLWREQGGELLPPYLLYDPDMHLDIATWHLRELVQRAKDRVDVFAMWNSGKPYERAPAAAKGYADRADALYRQALGTA